MNGSEPWPLAEVGQLKKKLAMFENQRGRFDFHEDDEDFENDDMDTPEQRLANDLDGTISSISALPKILDEVGNKCEVWMDGGIRTGQDILRAVALGAQGTLIGRAFLYGLGANGKDGVTQTLEILQKELDLTMGLCGKKNLSEVDKSILYQYQ